ncbi:MAG: bifunctional [glutamate--ammonia ligase]-adenylyl-L-tyrosine phosphorylase/[glutamate--ammonia-ligase] adenylyltransferase [Proteobacteria bacterium]|nr:bifunctional [glutamate--ammonia ligase]-adenylyl-L-tyrosine phosphorylase/[glutamate--ammonia-ligase] adenylyltransferase [Pseudomonadota bacterium]
MEDMPQKNTTQLISELDSKEDKNAIECLEKLGIKNPKCGITNLRRLFSLDVFNRKNKGRLISDVINSPNADLALNNIERLLTALPDETLDAIVKKDANLKDLSTICGGSQFITNIMLKTPALLSWLMLEDNISKSSCEEEKRADLAMGLNTVETMAELQRLLRSFKQREYLRIGSRDLSGRASTEEVMEELSDLASSCLQAAIDGSGNVLQREYGQPEYSFAEGSEEHKGFVILGMGKLGGRELNFSSDIDLIFLYGSEKGETSGINDGGESVKKIHLHQYFVKLGEMIVKAMNEVTEDGFVFRVDMNLRPDGQSGELVCSLRGAEIYYESWGQTWERSAMLKARPVAGDIALGETFLHNIRPFMYRKYLDFGAIDAISTMKKKIDAKIARDNQALTNLKLGTGGIREVEFFIQALQLINAGKIESLRERNSLKSLLKLQEAGLISPEDNKQLSEAYIFLRLIEHRLQIFQERQTHTLPNKPEELEKLALRAGYRKNALESFLEDHRKYTGNVNRIYSTLFHEAAEKLEEEKNPELIELLEGEMPEDEIMERLSTLGFRDVARAAKNLYLLWNGPPFVHFTEASKLLLRRIAPFIFKEITTSPEPDMALGTLEKFISAVGARSSLYSLLAENHHIIRLLVGLFGTSSFLSKILLGHPEILDALVAANVSSALKTKEEMSEELAGLMAACKDYEEELDTLRRFRNLEILRIGINDIYGELKIEDVSLQIALLAEVSLEYAYRKALDHVSQRYGRPISGSDKKCKEATFSIIGMGKLGGREMSYSSDLDIIFVYSNNGETSGEYKDKKGLKVTSNHEFFAKVGQTLISILSVPTREGHAFKVDTRLRPSGSSGALVTSLDNFRKYHEKSAQTWEKLALTRASVSAGDEMLGKKVLATIEESLYQNALTDEEAVDISRIRKRMELELAKEKEGIYNVKTGRGGIVDIEFIAQSLMLKHGKDISKIRTQNTGEALLRFRAAELLSEDEFKSLFDAYNFLRYLETRLRIVNDQSVSVLDTTSTDFQVLARRVGSDTTGLIQDYRRHTEKVRTIYKRFLPEAA